jgi:hypothetical protein
VRNGKMAAHIVLPWVHRIFSNLKVWALGVYHGLRRKHLQSYLDEFVFRFNRRVSAPRHRANARLCRPHRLPGPHTRAKSRLLAVGEQNPVRRGLFAGGNRIRTIGPAEKETAVRRLVLDPIQLIGPASPFGDCRETFRNSGTGGSNPVPSSGESKNFRFRAALPRTRRRAGLRGPHQGARVIPARAASRAHRGTDSSNPPPSRGESTNHRFRRRFHGLVFRVARPASGGQTTLIGSGRTPPNCCSECYSDWRYNRHAGHAQSH